MNDIDKELEIKKLKDNVHTHKLKNDIIQAFKYLLLAFSVILIIILISSIFRY